LQFDLPYFAYSLNPYPLTGYEPSVLNKLLALLSALLSLFILPFRLCRNLVRGTGGTMPFGSHPGKATSFEVTEGIKSERFLFPIYREQGLIVNAKGE
jgi:hypothetical protein